jgi:hypothetical protein
VTLGNRFFFTTGGPNPTDERVLNVTDGTAGGTLAIATTSTADPKRTLNHVPGPFAQGAWVYYVTEAADGHKELFRTDGSANGSLKLGDVAPAGSQDTFHFVAIDGGVLVLAEFFERKPGLVSDGTPAGTKAIDVGQANPLDGNGHAAYFARARGDGTTEVTRFGNATQPPASFVVNGMITEPACTGFVGDDILLVEQNGDVWRADGTSGTLLKSLGTPRGPRYCHSPAQTYDGKVLFFSDDQPSLGAIIATDGSAAGTEELGTFGLYGKTVPGKGVFFGDENGALTMWDGAFHTLVANAATWTLVPTQTGVLFMQGLGDNWRLMESDGTAAGTKEVVGAPYKPDGITMLGKKIVFSATSSNGDRELWGATP